MARPRKVSRGFQVVDTKTGAPLSEVFSSRAQARSSPALGPTSRIKHLEDYIYEEEYQSSAKTRTSTNARVAREKEHQALVAKYERPAPKVKPRLRPRSHKTFGTRAKDAAKKLFQELREWHGGEDASSFRFKRDPKPLPSRAKNVWQPVLPGVDARPRKPYSGGPLRKFVLGGGAPSAAHVIALKESSKPPARTALKPGKKTIEQINAEGINLRLRRAPYSKTGLVGDDYLSLNPYKGGWLVTHHGVHLGSTRRTAKLGWTHTGYPSPAGMATIALAQSMLDEYYAAGGK